MWGALNRKTKNRLMEQVCWATHMWGFLLHVGWIISAGQDGYGFNYTIPSTKWAMNSDVSNFFELMSANQSLNLDS
jgi:hypothetical protein